MQRDPARKAAMSVNIGTALFLALKVAVGETALAPGEFRSEGVAKAIRELLRVSDIKFHLSRARLRGPRGSYSARTSTSVT